MFVGPARGEMAESGEAGEGRMSEPLEIVAAVEAMLAPAKGPLAGKKIIVTSGPTHEPIDPVRYIANRSSGKQGHAIAAALATLGADVRLVSGPVSIPDPTGVTVTHVETARQMQAAVEALLPADAGVFVAAVADWRTEGEAGQKIKKVAGEGPPALQMVENPDILAGIGHHKQRPYLVVGFAAETNELEKNAQAKLKKKGADFIVANDVSHGSEVTLPLVGRVAPDARGGGADMPVPEDLPPPLAPPHKGEGDSNPDAVAGGVMGGERNRVKIASRDGIDAWPEMSKAEVAERLAGLIAEKLKTIEV
jgi:phosphopantothenoylcysteine decarboxylase/phosphopantothenate--cysteine ligase